MKRKALLASVMALSLASAAFPALAQNQMDPSIRTDLNPLDQRTDEDNPTGVLGMGQTFSRTITLGPNMAGEINIDELGTGDQVQLTLINPTDQPLTIQTTEALGPNHTWTVPPRSQQVVSFRYVQPFSDDVEFMVMDPSGMRVSQGTLFRTQQQQQIQTTQQQPMQPTTEERRSGVRGYW